MPWRRRQRRPDGPPDYIPPGCPRSSAACRTHSRGPARSRDASKPSRRSGDGLFAEVLAHDSTGRIGQACCAHDRSDDRGQETGGQVLGEGFEDLQLRTDDKRIHLLRRAGELFREVTSETNWPTYNGDPGGNRYTIDRKSVV